MKRAKSRAGRKTSRVSVGRAPRKAVDLAVVREEIRNQVGNAAAEMVANGIEEANKGHYGAMKFLFELAGLYPAEEGAEAGAQEDGLAKAVFSRLGITDAAPEVTNDCVVPAAAGNDAVE